ncbi:MAG: hypothetical protein HYU41_28695 [Candidatus Rokubacteria bacterium]|nr:hypothetical protein [Candidatus Rokubacteria bacterium]
MYSPEEAIEELEFASKQLGLRGVMLIPAYSVDDALAEIASAGVDGAVIHLPSPLVETVNALAGEAVGLHPTSFASSGISTSKVQIARGET